MSRRRKAVCNEKLEQDNGVCQMPSSAEDRVERDCEVLIEEGLHMRPAMQFVDCANGYECAVTIKNQEQSVDGKSIMQLTMLAATKGTKLIIIAEGVDAQEAVEALAAVLENRAPDNLFDR